MGPEGSHQRRHDGRGVRGNLGLARSNVETSTTDEIKKDVCVIEKDVDVRLRKQRERCGRKRCSLHRARGCQPKKKNKIVPGNVCAP